MHRREAVAGASAESCHGERGRGEGGGGGWRGEGTGALHHRACLITKNIRSPPKKNKGRERERRRSGQGGTTAACTLPNTLRTRWGGGWGGGAGGRWAEAGGGGGGRKGVTVGRQRERPCRESSPSLQPREGVGPRRREEGHPHPLGADTSARIALSAPRPPNTRALQSTGEDVTRSTTKRTHQRRRCSVRAGVAIHSRLRCIIGSKNMTPQRGQFFQQDTVRTMNQQSEEVRQILSSARKSTTEWT